MDTDVLWSLRAYRKHTADISRRSERASGLLSEGSTEPSPVASLSFLGAGHSSSVRNLEIPNKSIIRAMQP